MVSVSYTHLDVYKRQVPSISVNCRRINLVDGVGPTIQIAEGYTAVSYTHLDVYKRQSVYTLAEVEKLVRILRK